MSTIKHYAGRAALCRELSGLEKPSLVAENVSKLPQDFADLLTELCLPLPGAESLRNSEIANRKLANSESDGHPVSVLRRLAQRVTGLLRRTQSAISERLLQKGALTGAVVDLFCSHGQVLAENALLRQQLMVASRKVKRPKLNTWMNAICGGSFSNTSTTLMRRGLTRGSDNVFRVRDLALS